MPAPACAEAADARGPAQPPARPGPRSRGTVPIAAAGTLLVLLGYTVPLSTVEPTAVDLGAGAAFRTWALTATPLGLAALLLSMGSAADSFGRKRVFGAGAALMLLATALSAAAPTAGFFLAGRVLQGVAGAALLAPGLGLIGHVHPPGPGRVRATGVWGAAVGLGIAVGPVYAALVERAAGWRAVHWGLAAFSAALLLAAVLGLEESRGDRPRGLDPLGVLTLGAGTACLIAGLSEGRDGWARGGVLVLLALGSVLLAAFVLVERRSPAPMLDLALLRSRGFVVACCGALFAGLAVVGLMSCLPMVLQRALGLSPLGAAGVLAVWSGLSFATALQARRLAARMSAYGQVAAALLACAVGEAALYGMHAGDSWARAVPGLALAGAGTGVLNAALARLSVSAVPEGSAAMGSGANNTARYAGSSLGAAVTLTLVGRASAGEGGPESVAEGGNAAVLVSAALCVVGALIVWWGRGAEREPGR
ncbi:MFS transporter [Streptomyces sp. ODS28]|uniref:MFS transporter n=1 Tax=Streptomyces sp. ODS28 TaxID=3136688 RepID=UPI0031EC5936